MYTSNVFAILGLRSLGLGVVLIFVGIKMLLAHSRWKIDTLLSLAVIAVVLAIAVVASILRPKSEIPPRASDV